MQVTAKVLTEVSHTHERIAALVNQYVSCAANVHLADEDDYHDFAEELLDILLDFTREVDNG